MHKKLFEDHRETVFTFSQPDRMWVGVTKADIKAEQEHHKLNRQNDPGYWRFVDDVIEILLWWEPYKVVTIRKGPQSLDPPAHWEWI
jgi:hypothetical protein